MIDWLVPWGVSSAVGFAFKEVLTPLAKGALEDYTKDFFKDSIKDFTERFKKEPLQIAVGKALKEFLQLVQQELEDTDLDEEELQQYIKPLRQFIQNKTVKETLGSAFQEDCRIIDTETLIKTWHEMSLLSLPDEFDWEKLGKRYLKKVKAIIRESDELRKILDSQALGKLEEHAQEIAGIAPDFDLIKYREGIQERYANLKLESLDTSGYAYNELKLWRMFIPQNVRESQEFLPQVYEIPKEYQKKLIGKGELEAELSFEELERYRKVYAQQPIRPVLEVIKDQQYEYVVILGDPGSGKSTLLQYIALEWAELPTKELPLHSIPLLIELRRYMRSQEPPQQCKTFLEFIHRSSSWVGHLNQNDLHEYLKAGKAVVMFDALDEVFDLGKREDVISQIHNFTQDYPNVQVIVTSRVIGYKPQQLRDAEFCHFMLQDLESEQIDDFIQRWHDLTYKNEEEKFRKRERLKRAINESTAIQELAGNPLLLTMMAILNRNQDLPRDRAKLYERSSELLLYQWDVEAKLLEDPELISVDIDYQDKQAMLRNVAYFMQATEKGLAGNLISYEDLKTVLIKYLKTIDVTPARKVARLMIDQLRSRNFILCYLGAETYAFVHRTFLEYFCAWEFVWQFKEKQTLSIGQLKTEVFGKHWQDESWHEVLLLIAGMIEANFVGEIIAYLMAQKGDAEKFLNLFLATKCLSEVRNKKAIAATASQLLKQLKGLTNYDLNYYYELWDTEETELVREIRTQAVAAVAATGKDDPDTLPWLKQRAQADEDGSVRYAAVQELARGWQDDPDTLPILKQRAQADEDGSVRSAAVQELARGWQDDPEMFEFLCDRAVNDPFERQDDWEINPRQTVLEAIIQQYPDHSQTLKLLRDRAENDPDEKVRKFVVQELARGWKHDLNTLVVKGVNETGV